MQSMKFVLPMMLALVVSSYVSAEDMKPVAKEAVLTGKLSEAKDAKPGVVACIKVGDKMVCLWSKDEALVKALTEGAKAGAEVKVTGTAVDADNFAATKCEACVAAPKAPEHK